MKVERRNLENHILRTQNWCENQGKWRAHVYEAEVWKAFLFFVVVFFFFFLFKKMCHILSIPLKCFM